MEPIREFFNIDWKTLCIAIFTALIGFQAIVKVWNWFIFEYLGIETKSMRNRREEHDLLISTANGLKDLSEKHNIDVKNSIEHDKKIEDNLNSFIDEMKFSILDTQKSIQNFTDNRIHDREQSLEIQKELTNSINQIAKSDEKRDEQIENLITSQKESLADRINQKYKFYLANNGIPEDEVDEFISLHSIYNKLGGNHHGDAKFKYCMEHLPMIPVDVKLKYDNEK